MGPKKKSSGTSKQQTSTHAANDKRETSSFNPLFALTAPAAAGYALNFSASNTDRETTNVAAPCYPPTTYLESLHRCYHDKKSNAPIVADTQLLLGGSSGVDAAHARTTSMTSVETDASSAAAAAVVAVPSTASAATLFPAKTVSKLAAAYSVRDEQYWRTASNQPRLEEHVAATNATTTTQQDDAKKTILHAHLDEDLAEVPDIVEEVAAQQSGGGPAGGQPDGGDGGGRPTVPSVGMMLELADAVESTQSAAAQQEVGQGTGVNDTADSDVNEFPSSLVQYFNSTNTSQEQDDGVVSQRQQQLSQDHVSKQYVAVFGRLGMLPAAAAIVGEKSTNKSSHAAGTTTTTTTALLAKIPDPRNVQDSFFPLRHIALRDRGYCSSINGQGITNAVVAIDKPNGKGSKMFQTLAPHDVFPFVSQIPKAASRNLYTVVDPHAPLDAFFDIDGHLFANDEDEERNPSSSGNSIHVASLASWLPMELLKMIDAKTTTTTAKFIVSPDEYASAPPGSPVLSWNPQQVEEAALYVLIEKISGALEEYFFEKNQARAKRDVEFKEQKKKKKSAQQERGQETLSEEHDIVAPKVAKIAIFSSSAALLTAIHRDATDIEIISTQNVDNPQHAEKCQKAVATLAKKLQNTKTSYHLHIRMSDGACFSNIGELRDFIRNKLLAHKYRAKAEERAMREQASVPVFADDLPPHTWKDHLLERLVDDSIYTQWRPFRLPFNCKSVSSSSSAPSVFLQTHAESSGNSSFMVEDENSLGNTKLRMQLPLVVGPSTTAFAPLRTALEGKLPATIFTSSEEDLGTVVTNYIQQHNNNAASTGGMLAPPTLVVESGVTQLFREYMQYAASLSAGSTVATAMAFSVEALEMSLIARIADPTLTAEDRIVPGGHSLLSLDEDDAALVHAQQEHQQLAPGAKPPIPQSGIRMPVSSDALRALREMFSMLHPEFHAVFGYDEQDQPLTPGAYITAQYEDNGCFRSYYVYQKNCKYCLKAHRHHKHTYGQLFITYKSIKFKCYSNDCHDSQYEAFRFPTSEYLNSEEFVKHTSPQEKGRVQRMLELREMLLPDLPVPELMRRYPWEFAHPASEVSGNS